MTSVYGLSKENLYVTYFEGNKSLNLEPDNEVREIWLQYLPENHIVKGNKKDNFWEMGETGPCGTCTEIFFDSIGGGIADLINISLI